LRLRAVRGRLKIGGERNNEFASNPNLAGAFDGTPEPRDDAVAQRQPQPCPHAPRLGREERVEDSLADFLVPTASGIANADGHAAGVASGLDMNLALSFNRLLGITENIHKYLIELTAWSADGPQITVIGVYGDPVPDTVRQQVQAHLQRLVQVEQFEFLGSRM